MVYAEQKGKNKVTRKAHNMVIIGIQLRQTCRDSLSSPGEKIEFEIIDILIKTDV